MVFHKLAVGFAGLVLLAAAASTRATTTTEFASAVRTWWYHLLRPKTAIAKSAINAPQASSLGPFRSISPWKEPQAPPSQLSYSTQWKPSQNREETKNLPCFLVAESSASPSSPSLPLRSSFLSVFLAEKQQACACLISQFFLLSISLSLSFSDSHFSPSRTFFLSVFPRCKGRNGLLGFYGIVRQ